MAPVGGTELGGKAAMSRLAAQGLVALREGDAATAVDLLERAAATERELGYAFDAAALELDLAEALDAAGEGERAAVVRGEAESFMAALACVNPL